MSVHFKKAPLLEMVAELRWGGNTAPIIWGSNTNLEQVLIYFGGAAAATGYTQLERNLPPEAPIMPFQTVYKFRNPDPTKQNILFQLGPNALAINATPPYKNWESFRPHIVTGIQNLYQAYEKAAQQSPTPTQIVLRYIDGFGLDFYGDVLDVQKFISEKLGFRLDLPPILDKYAPDRSSRTVALSVSAPLNDTGTLTINLSRGMVNNAPVIVMDTTVVLNKQVEQHINSAMALFDEAHEVIRELFVEISKPLSEKMEPKYD